MSANFVCMHIWNVEHLMLEVKWTSLHFNAGDQLAIAKETGRRLGMGTNMYPSSSLLGREKDENEALPVDELIEKADGFAGVFPGIWVLYWENVLFLLDHIFHSLLSFPVRLVNNYKHKNKILRPHLTFSANK